MGIIEFLLILGLIWYIHSRGEKKGRREAEGELRNARIDAILGALDDIENVEDIAAARARLREVE